MRLGGPARFVVSVRRPEEVAEAYQFAEEQGLPTWALGGGANTIGRDEGFPGVVILNELTGVETGRAAAAAAARARQRARSGRRGAGELDGRRGVG